MNVEAFRSDLLLALAVTVACEVELFTDGHSPRHIAGAVLLAAGGAAVIWRRRAPIAASCLTLVLTLAAVALVPGHDLVTPQYVLLLPPYTIGAWTTRRRALAGLAVCLAALGVFGVVTASSPGSWLFAAGMTAGSFFVGRAVRSQRLLAADLEAVAESIAASREDASRLVVEDVRSRISADVNALVAQSVASMVIAAEAALRLVPVDAGGAEAAMLAIEEMGQEALSEMRRVLGVLRHEVRAA